MHSLRWSCSRPRLTALTEVPSRTVWPVRPITTPLGEPNCTTYAIFPPACSRTFTCMGKGCCISVIISAKDAASFFTAASSRAGSLQRRATTRPGSQLDSEPVSTLGMATT